MPTNWLEREEGRLAYSDEGDGPLVVCVPGLGDMRQEYRFLAPGLVEAGFRVVALDLRGHGESSTGWERPVGRGDRHGRARADPPPGRRARARGGHLDGGGRGRLGGRRRSPMPSRAWC